MDRLSDYNIAIPESLIATAPLSNRSDSRLLVLQKEAPRPSHGQFRDIIDFLQPGDALVLNDTRVFPARLIGKKVTGGKVEVLLGRPLEDGNWTALLGTKRRLHIGDTIHFESGASAVLMAKDCDPGVYCLRFDRHPLELALAIGHIPLPKYMGRTAEAEDRQRYQTVFAHPQHTGACAAPTAGLHFTNDLLEQIRAKGVALVYITLHVGPGTFLPVRVENLDEHQMHAEAWEISQEAVRELNRIKTAGGRIVAVGTTAVRTLETAVCADNGTLEAGSGLTRLFIRPGHQFKAVDAMITNFHQPKTTLLLLVAAAIGRERLLAAYQEAIDQRYRFFSYGDACFFEVTDSAR